MNDENLIPFTSEQNREEAKKNGSKGGKASGRARREKANLRKLAQQVLDDSYKDLAGNEYTGAELFVRGLVSNLTNPDGKNWSKTMDLLITLTGAGKSKEEIEALKAQAELTRAKAQAINSGGAGIDIEDLQPLAEMLKHDENTDDTVETVLEET